MPVAPPKPRAEPADDAAWARTLAQWAAGKYQHRATPITLNLVENYVPSPGADAEHAAWAAEHFECHAITAFLLTRDTGLTARSSVWQLEIGNSGTLHVQAYVEWDRPIRLGTARRLDVFFGKSAHYEPRRYSRFAAADYCRKAASRLPGTEPGESGEFEKGGQVRSGL
jgi:hypothetical protein